MKLQVLQKAGPSAGSAWLLTRSLPDSSVTGCAAEGKQNGQTGHEAEPACEPGSLAPSGSPLNYPHYSPFRERQS